MNLPARLLFYFSHLTVVVAGLFLVLLFSSSQVQAQTYSSTADQNTRQEVSAILDGMFSYVSCSLSGYDVMQNNAPCNEALLGTNGEKQLGGIAGALAYSTQALYTPSVTNYEYGRYLSQNFGIAKTAHAQNEGFEALDPVMKIWLSIRDLTYIIMVVVFILIGFGIMVRYKLDPKAVMTVQNQLPKVVVTLVLISFSYAIAGLMVDVMWLTTYVGLNTLGASIERDDLAGNATQNIMNNPVNFATDTLDGTSDAIIPLDGLREISGGVGKFVAGNVADIFLSLLGLQGEHKCDPGVDVGWDWGKLTLNPFGDGPLDVGTSGFSGCVTGTLAGLIKILVQPVIYLIVLIALIIALVRLWWVLIKCYIYIILYTILAPLWFLLGLLPNSRFGFTNWLRAMAARSLVFPAAAALIFSAKIFLDNTVLVESTGNDFIPPLVGNPSFLQEGLGALIAFGIIMLAPEILNILMEAFKTQPFKYTPAITGGFARGAAVGAAAASPVLAKMWGKNKEQPGPARLFLNKGLRAAGSRAITKSAGNKVIGPAAQKINRWTGIGKMREAKDWYNQQKVEEMEKRGPSGEYMRMPYAQKAREDAIASYKAAHPLPATASTEEKARWEKAAQAEGNRAYLRYFR